MLLRAIDAKFWGVVAMGGTVVILFFLPWLDQSPVKSIRYRPDWHKWLYGIFIVNFLVLGYIGTQPPSPPFNLTVADRHADLPGVLLPDAGLEPPGRRSSPCLNASSITPTEPTTT